MKLTLEAIAKVVLPRVPRGRALASTECRTLVSVAEVLMREGPHGVSPEDIATNVESFLIRGRSRRAWRVRILLRGIEVCSLPRFRRPFSRLSVAERRALVVDDWIEGRSLGRIFGKVRNLVVLGAYGDPRAAIRTGYLPVHQRKRFRAESSVMRESA